MNEYFNELRNIEFVFTFDAFSLNFQMNSFGFDNFKYFIKTHRSLKKSVVVIGVVMKKMTYPGDQMTTC